MSANETEKHLRHTITAMQKEGAKLSVFAVAKRAGVSNATIHNRYPHIRDEINALKDKQSAPQKDKSANDVVKLKATKDKHYQEAKSARAREAASVAHLMETYRLCDELHQENEALRQRLGETEGDVVRFPSRDE
tara:strand:- start:2835 stop:3239 length:405 start_codon:yes stop_codon:yes gene_type:complete